MHTRTNAPSWLALAADGNDDEGEGEGDTDVNLDAEDKDKKSGGDIQSARDIVREITALEETVAQLQELAETAVECAKKFAVRDAQLASLKAMSTLDDHDRTLATSEKNKLLAPPRRRKR